MASRISTQKIKAFNSSQKNQQAENTNPASSEATHQSSAMVQPQASSQPTIVEGGSSED